MSDKEQLTKTDTDSARQKQVVSKPPSAVSKAEEKRIETQVSKLAISSESSTMTEITRKISLLRQKLGDLAQKIKTITDQGRLSVNDRSHFSSFRGMYKKLDSYYDSYQKVWDELMEVHVFNGRESEFPTKSDSSARQNTERYFYESCSVYEDYVEATSKLPTDPSTLNTTLFNESKMSHSRNILPRINIPKFDGTLENWPVYRDTFRSIIHDDITIGNIEKFHHLITSLSGPALSLVKSIPLLAENYPQAWSVLKDVYDDPRRLANTYLQRVIDFKPLIGKPSAASLRSYISGIIESVKSLQNLGIPNLAEFILFTLAVRGLDTSTRELFEVENIDIEYPKFSDLSDFVKKRCRVLEISTSHKEVNQDKSTKYVTTDLNRKKPYPKPTSTQSFVTTRSGYQTSDPDSNNFSKTESVTNKKSNISLKPSTSHFKNNSKPFSGTSLSCCLCEGTHILSICPIFICASSLEKNKLIEGMNVCQNCLYFGHRIQECKSLKSCRICNQRHHTMLHTERLSLSKNTTTKSSSPQSITKTAVLTSLIPVESEILLGTAVALIKDLSGNYKKIRLLIDSASQHSFITRSCVRKLGLIPTEATRKIVGLNQAVIQGVKGRVSCTLKPLVSSDETREIKTEALIVPSISMDLPALPLPQWLRIKYAQYQLADPTFWKPGCVDLLLGADLYCNLITGTPIEIEQDHPSILPTIFGNIIIGRFSHREPSTYQTFTTSHNKNTSQSSDSLGAIMKKFWELEEPSTRSIPLSKEEQFCEDHFLATHQRTDNGRYMVMLPFKKENIDLGGSKQRALSRLMNLEKKLIKNPDIKQEYITFMDEYCNLGHMAKTNKQGAYYVPHHSIVKQTESGSKLRVVFDASAPASHGSLNDSLLPGPKLQQDISNIILNFRTHKIVFTTDIQKMFRQILIHPVCRKFLHILWRIDPSLQIEEFELLTLIYGINCAPFLAIRTILQLVKDEGSKYSLASKVLLNDTYVDDIVTGAATVQEALLIKQELVELLSRGGFKLSKWSSNNVDLLKDEDTCNLVNLSPDENLKILGFQWEPKGDYFSYTIQPTSSIITKRSILSSIARIYDPLGYLAPVIFYTKHILQSIWISGCDWDDPVPSEICERWAEFTSQLNIFEALRIPRFISCWKSQRFQLIGFSDASIKGYCATLYVRVIGEQEIQPFLIKAKTKLAPIKTISVPRLELCASLLLSRLVQSVASFISRLDIKDIRLFTDSTIVLSWLKLSPNKLNIFVANRVTEILETTKHYSWKHVRSEENPSDLGSRGLLPKDLINNYLWWNGPSWLSLPEDEWPEFEIKHLQEVELPEIKSFMENTGAVFITTKHKETSDIIHWMEKHSNYTRMIRIMAYILRFINKDCKYKLLSISASEFAQANLRCIKLLQSHYFREIIKPSSKQFNQLSSLAPFYDEDHILRVGGRLRNSNLPTYSKHPILLPRHAHYTKILINYYHRIHLHIGAASLQAIIQLRYWIPSARRLIRKLTHDCIVCFRYAGATQPPIMSDLPSSRFSEEAAFFYTGVDFFGPLLCKDSLRRKSSVSKAYVCLFVCLSSKAIHLEVVPSLSTRDFLDALDRFIARRGKPSVIISDCGTNFIGAVTYLKEVAQWISQCDTRNNIVNHATHQGIEWRFNPPRTPHFGGLWEAGVKQAKTLFKKVMANRSFTFNELSTIFTKIEAILNSRPIGPVSSDPNDPSPLTPGHLLIGRPLTALPEPDITDVNENRLVRWQVIQQRTQEFWNRWRTEYLQTLQSRSKWRKNSDNIAIGDCVILTDENSAPLHWPLGVIENIFPGNDGIVRVVEVRTSKGIYKRPAIKLLPLKHILNPPTVRSQDTT